ncbi:MAG: enoyl-CoA hydratase/isomerase family protein [Pseudomonadota bacterium]
MTDPSVIVRKQGRAGRLTLNRPKALHALNQDMCERITAALLDWKDDPDVEFVLVDHASDTRGFCAGGDILMLAESGRSDGIVGASFFAAEYRLNTLIYEYPKPYVAVIDGVTMGGGVGISVHAPYRIATENTLFAMPESGIGLLPDVGGGYFLPRLAGELGTWLALTGARLKGEDVLALGVATHFAPAETLADLKERLCQDGPDALTSLQTEATGRFEPHLDDINACFAGQTLEMIVDSLATGSEWAQAQNAILATKSPLTMKVSLRQMREGAELAFRDVMRMEYRICSRMIKTANFQEGVRAVLVDRDQAPNWDPKTLSDVTDDLVDGFFQPLGASDLTFLEI